MARNVVRLGRPFEDTVFFSLGVVVSGRVLHTAGITARDPAGEVVGNGDMAAQVKQCFANLGAIVAAVGGSFDNVIKYTIYTTDIDLFNESTREIRAPFFSGRPGATLVEVAKLVDPRMLVEIEAVVSLDP